VVPGNDDAIRAVTLISTVVADAVQEGQGQAGRDMVERAGGATFEPDEPAPQAEVEPEPEVQAEPPTPEVQAEPAPPQAPETAPAPEAGTGRPEPGAALPPEPGTSPEEDLSSARQPGGPVPAPEGEGTGPA
jgi:small subunit ribosomal protein S2